MTSQSPALNTATALSYLGQTVLVELVWDDEPESFWQCMHVVCSGQLISDTTLSFFSA